MGTQPPPTKGAEPSNLRPMSIVAKRMDATWHGGRPQTEDFVFDEDQPPSPKGGGLPLPNSQYSAISIVAKQRMHQDATWYGGRPQLRRLCVTWGPSSPKQKRA